MKHIKKRTKVKKVVHKYRVTTDRQLRISENILDFGHQGVIIIAASTSLSLCFQIFQDALDCKQKNVERPDTKHSRRILGCST